MISPPDCAPLLSRPEPRALRVQRRWEGSKQCLVSLSPSFPQPTTDSGRGPSVQHQGSALTAENKASRSKWQPSERKPDKSPQCHSGGWFPTSGHCLPFPCEGKKKKKCTTCDFPADLQSSPQGISGWSLGKAPSDHHPIFQRRQVSFSYSWFPP